MGDLLHPATTGFRPLLAKFGHPTARRDSYARPNGWSNCLQQMAYSRNGNQPLSSLRRGCFAPSIEMFITSLAGSTTSRQMTSVSARAICTVACARLPRHQPPSISPSPPATSSGRSCTTASAITSNPLLHDGSLSHLANRRCSRHSLQQPCLLSHQRSPADSSSPHAHSANRHIRTGRSHLNLDARSAGNTTTKKTIINGNLCQLAD